MLIKWRKWNNILHRDIGYAAAALTIIYAVSGIAVNHIGDWNPNYQVLKETIEIQPIHDAATTDMKINIMEQLNLPDEPKSVFRPDPETIQLFYSGKTYTVDIPTGKGVIEYIRPRRVLFEFNQLHLNAPKKVWTWIADIYAGALIIVSITGLFVLKGKNGITGRGAFFTIFGALIPAVFWIWYQYL